MHKILSSICIWIAFTLPVHADTPFKNVYMATSNDGKFIAVSQKERIAIWNSDFTRKVMSLAVPARKNVTKANFLVFSPDGKYLAATMSNSIFLFDLQKKTKIHQFDDAKDWVRTVVFAPDSKRLYALALDNQLYAWDVNRRVKLYVIENIRNEEALDISADGRLIALSPHPFRKNNIAAILANAENGALVKNLYLPQEGVRQLKFVGSQYLIADNHLIDIASGRKLRTFKFPDFGKLSWSNGRIAISSDQTLVAFGKFGHLFVYEIATGKKIFQEFSLGVCRSLAFIPHTKKLIGNFDDQSEGRLWDISSVPKPVDVRLAPFGSTIGISSAFAFGPEGEFSATGSDETILLYKNDTGRMHTILKPPDLGQIQKLYFTRDSRIVAHTGRRDVQIIDINNDQKIVKLKHTDNIDASDFSHRQNHLVTVDSSKVIRVWDVKSTEVIAEETLPTKIGRVWIHATEPVVACVTVDREVLFYNYSQNKIFRKINASENHVHFIRFIPDSTRAVIGYDNGVHSYKSKSHMDIYDYEKGTVMQTFKPVRGFFADVALSADGHRLATIGSSIGIYEQNQGTFKPMLSLKSMIKEGAIGAFSDDGKILGVRSTFNEISIWDLP